MTVDATLSCGPFYLQRQIRRRLEKASVFSPRIGISYSLYQCHCKAIVRELPVNRSLAKIHPGNGGMQQIQEVNFDPKRKIVVIEVLSCSSRL